MKMNPAINEVAAFLVLNLHYNINDFQQWAIEWINQGTKSSHLDQLAFDSVISREEIQSHFEKFLDEQGSKLPTKKEAAKIILKTYLQDIVDGRIDPYAGTKMIHFNVYDQVVDEYEEQRVVGDCLGLEEMFGWYYALEDLEDGSSEESEDFNKLHCQEGLVREAKKLLEEINIAEITEKGRENEF